ncbi:YqhG family protein [Domibacillus robiginosus]|uniref:YqhG family protein n=1 Tax=Domibacillus robiginosus TaxID=1071054 RepID=UPI00067DA1F3|nr:YqhG family protein [Domibacillus robiginosus]
MSFIRSFFTACECSILEESEHSLTIQLTEEADRALMNRPFYWHYKDRLGQAGDPMAITFFTKDPGRPLKHQEEYITFGSPRFHQLLSYAQKKASFVQLYETQKTAGMIQLDPWLFVHFHLSYEANGKKEKLVPLALHLINGAFSDRFLEMTGSLTLSHSISPYHYVLSPLITPASGLTRLKQKLWRDLLEEEHVWAQTARKKQKAELELLQSFFEQDEDNAEHFEREKAAIMRRFEPVIRVSVLNGGLFYLAREK